VPLDGIKVFVVEDDPDAAEMIATVLREQRAEVVTVNSAEAALNVLIEYRPDVLICDIGLPDIDGYAFMTRVRQMERAGGRPPVPSIALTGFVEEGERVRATSAGYQIHITKPVEPDALVKTVADIVFRRS
jgi:CheY-like chemotaxis protein